MLCRRQSDPNTNSIFSYFPECVQDPTLSTFFYPLPGGCSLVLQRQGYFFSKSLGLKIHRRPLRFMTEEHDDEK